jgi:DNA polymerase-3 subunit beta
MKFSAERESLLAALQSVIGVVERRQTMPILANLLLSAESGKLSDYGHGPRSRTRGQHGDQVRRGQPRDGPGSEAPRYLPLVAGRRDPHVQPGRRQMTVKAGKSRFVLATLPAATSRNRRARAAAEPHAPAGDFKRLLDKTHFLMAQQDVRYYLNGCCWKRTGKCFERSRLTAIVWHCARWISLQSTGQQVIIPRKGVLELQRLLGPRAMF